MAPKWSNKNKINTKVTEDQVCVCSFITSTLLLKTAVLLFAFVLSTPVCFKNNKSVNVRSSKAALLKRNSKLWESNNAGTISELLYRRMRRI